MKKVYKKIVRCDYNFDGKHWKNVSNDAKDLVSKILNVDPKKRYCPLSLCQKKKKGTCENYMHFFFFFDNVLYGYNQIQNDFKFTLNLAGMSLVCATTV